MKLLKGIILMCLAFLLSCSSDKDDNNITATLSSFVGYNNYITTYDLNPDGKYKPGTGEQVVGMGLRGLIPIREN